MARWIRGDGAKSAQQRKGEYSPFKRLGRGKWSLRTTPLNKGRGNIPPSSQSTPRRSRGRRRRSTKEGGIFPLQGGQYLRGAIDCPRSTKEGGIFPLQAGCGLCVDVMTPLAQQRKGEYSPFKLTGVGCTAHTSVRSTKEGGIFPLQDYELDSPTIPDSDAQQRKGEYSPFKGNAAGAPVVDRVRSTKEGGIFPLQGQG